MTARLLAALLFATQLAAADPSADAERMAGRLALARFRLAVIDSLAAGDGTGLSQSRADAAEAYSAAETDLRWLGYRPPESWGARPAPKSIARGPTELTPPGAGIGGTTGIGFGGGGIGFCGAFGGLGVPTQAQAQTPTGFGGVGWGSSFGGVWGLPGSFGGISGQCSSCGCFGGPAPSPHPAFLNPVGRPRVEAPKPSGTSYVKVRVEVEARGVLAYADGAATVSGRVRISEREGDGEDAREPAASYVLLFTRSPDLRESAKALDGREVVVVGMSELRMAAPPRTEPGWVLQRTVEVTGITLAK